MMTCWGTHRCQEARPQPAGACAALTIDESGGHQPGHAQWQMVGCINLIQLCLIFYSNIIRSWPARWAIKIFAARAAALITKQTFNIQVKFCTFYHSRPIRGSYCLKLTNQKPGVISRSPVILKWAAEGPREVP